MEPNNHKIFKTSNFFATVSVICSSVPLIAPSFAFHATITIGSVQIVEIQVKTEKKTEARPVTATENSGPRSRKRVMT
jgi:hypothetical protein